MPDKKIPELQLLSEKNWLDAVKDAKQLETETDLRQALANLLNSAKMAFADIARDALTKYAEANRGQLPGDCAPAVDNEYDSFYEFSLHGLTSYDLNKPSDVVELATVQFASTHGGLLPSDPSQLAPFLRKPMEPAQVQRVLNQIPEGIRPLDQLNALGPK
jgi:hypothetical protein